MNNHLCISMIYKLTQLLMVDIRRIAKTQNTLGDNERLYLELTLIYVKEFLIKYYITFIINKIDSYFQFYLAY